MEKINLFIDMDNTITDTFKGIEAAYNMLYHDYKDFKPAIGENIRKYNMLDECPLIERKDIGKIFACQELWDNLELFTGAYRVLNSLKEYFNLFIVSIGTYDNISKKSQWIKEHLPIIDDSIFLASDRIPCKADKSIIDMSKGILIDDHMDNILSSNAKIKICFGRDGDWNEKYYSNREQNIYRCYDWHNTYWLLKEFVNDWKTVCK